MRAGRILAIAIAMLMVVPTVSGAVVEQDSERFYMRWVDDNPDDTGCGSNRFLSTRAGEDIVCSGLLLPQGIEYTFPAEDLEPFTLDSGGQIAGHFDLQPGSGLTYGVGTGEITVEVTALFDDDYIPVTLGSHTETLTLTPATEDASVDFTFDVADDLDGEEVTALDFTFILDGAAVVPFDYGLSGASYLDVPMLVDSPDQS